MGTTLDIKAFLDKDEQKDLLRSFDGRLGGRWKINSDRPLAV